jgi:hypothetical protein
MLSTPEAKSQGAADAGDDADNEKESRPVRSLRFEIGIAPASAV